MAVKRREWACARGERAWKRNVVIAKALTPRPDRTNLTRKPGGRCPICQAGGEHLAFESRQPYLSQPAALTWLGIKSLRLSRNRLDAVCNACGTSFAGKSVLDWNAASARRRYADFGVVRMPMPHECKKRNVYDVLVTQLAPEKRHLVNWRAARWMSRKDRKMARLSQWRNGWRQNSLQDA